MTSPNPNGSTVVSVSENVTGIVYTPAATDPEGDAITWSISGTDSTSFNID
jgi:serralysin